MTESAVVQDAEFSAMHVVYKTLEPLDPDSRQRVVDYVVARLGVAVGSAVRGGGKIVANNADTEELLIEQDEAVPSETKFETFAELFDAAGPRSNADKALIAGYWVQVCEGADSFDSFSINKLLKDLGHGIPNITAAIETLKNQKPALALQLKKSGRSQQSRKTYKVTVSGISSIERMVGVGGRT